MSESMEFGATERGFALVEWTDRYDHRCSLQKSSLASDDCIWLGVNDAEPKILASVALRMGLPTNGETTGWVPYAVPEEVSMQTRMHLTRDMVRALLPLLQHFAETGEIPDKSTETAGQAANDSARLDFLEAQRRVPMHVGYDVENGYTMWPIANRNLRAEIDAAMQPRRLAPNDGGVR